MGDDNEELFVFGTQVQAGVDEFQDREKTRGVWRERLSEYALRGEEVVVEKTKKRLTQQVGKGKGKMRKGKGNESGKGRVKGQRLFKSINRETIRAHTEGNECDRGDDDKRILERVYSEEEWAEVHGKILESLPRKKRRIQWEVEEGGCVEDSLQHWTPPPLCDEEAKALYEDGGLIEEVDNDSVSGLSGIFTLSQVLGERENEQFKQPILVVSDSGEESEGIIIRANDSVIVEKVIEVEDTSEEAEVIVLSDSDESNNIQGSKDYMDALRYALLNSSLWVDVAMYKPISVKEVCSVAKIPLNEGRKGLDILGICWVD